MGQLVSGYLDFAERQAEREQVMTICINFKDFVEPGKIETEPLLAEMPAYAKRYQILLGGNSGSAALDACIDRLNRLETMVIRPYFLEVLRLYNENKLTLAQVTEIFLTTENYLFRRTMCDLPTNRSNFTGRIAPARSRKSPEIKPFHGHWSTFAGKAHGIKDRVLLDDTCGSGGFFVRTKKQRGDME